MNLAVGSMVSLFVGAISHEAYNIKGPVTALRDVQENEKFVCDKLRHGIYEPCCIIRDHARFSKQVLVENSKRDSSI